MKKSTNIEISQNIGNIAGGSAVGMQIQSLTVMGSFIIRPPKDQIPRPPDEQVVCTYLEHRQKWKIEAELSKVSEKFVLLRDAFRDQLSKNNRQRTGAGEASFTSQPSSVTRAEAAESSDAKSPQPQQGSEIAKLIEPLWRIPFRARKAEDAESEPLYDAIQHIFEEEQSYGANQRLVLLADPGTGKTPALRGVQRQYAANSLKFWNDMEQRSIPFYIKLAHLRTGQSLPALLADVFNQALSGNGDQKQVDADQMIGLLEEYKCLFLFDDLDELLSTEQVGRLKDIDYFMYKYPEHQYVVTCRTSSYRQQLGSLQRLYLDGLTQEDVKKSLNIDDQMYNQLAATSSQMITNRSMLASYVVLDQSSELVRVKGQFLLILMRYRLSRNEEKYRELGVDSQIIVPLLEHLAISMRLDRTHDYGEQKLMQSVADYLERWHESCSWRQVLSALKKTELLAYDDYNRSWRFCDRVDEALFAANAVIHGQLTHQELLAHVSDYWWRDLFEILVGLAPDAQSLMIEILDQDVLTAANCIKFVGQSVSDAIEEALIDSLQERIGRESSSRRKFIVEHIGGCAKPRAAVALLQVLYREWSSIVVITVVKAIQVWARRCSKDPHEQLKLIGKAEKEVMHAYPAATDSVTSLLGLYPGEGRLGQVGELCKKLENPTLSPKFRGLAAIGLGFAHTKQTTAEAEKTLFGILEIEAVDDFVAWCVVEALTRLSQRVKADDLKARIGKRAKELFEQKESTSKGYSRMRARAAYLLGWLTDKTVTGEFMRGALADQNPFVRGYIIEAMARRDLRDARQIIEDHLREEKHPFVLRKVAEVLGQIGTMTSIHVLESHLRSNQALARWSARAAIGEILERNALELGE